MVRKLFYVFLTLIALGSPAVAAGPKCDDCKVFLRGVHRQVTPTPDTRCVPFVQPHKGNVLLRLNLKNGKTRSYTKKNAGTSDCIVVGRQWLKELTDTMYICNDENHADYPSGDVHEVAVEAKFSRKNEACLFGKDACAAKGYKTK